MPFKQIGYSLLVLLISGMFACVAPQQISRQNTAFTYFKNPDRLNPQYVIYHQSADSSTVYFSVRQSKLLFTKTGDAFTANVRIKCFLFDSFDAKTAIDTTERYFSFTQSADTNTIFTGSFNIPVAQGKHWVAQLIFYDVNRKVYNNALVEIDKQNAHSAQYFLLKDYNNDKILFNRYVGRNQAFTIHLADTAITTLYIKYYGKEIAPPQPPFSDASPVQPLKPDTVLTVDVQGGISAPQQWLSEGLYIVTADTAGMFGLAITRTYADYPELTEAAHVLKPLRYITSKDEYAGLEKAENTKKAVDDFWLRVAGTANHAREVLRNYYKGVSLANQFFTTTREGWKTDRGMVYSIFGQPFSVYRTATTETWSYGTNNSPFTPTFTFEKRADGLAGYDYYLRRSDLLKPTWYEMVENWRNGRLVYWY